MFIELLLSARNWAKHCVWITSLKPLTISCDYCYHPIFTNEASEDQRGGVSCPQSHSRCGAGHVWLRVWGWFQGGGQGGTTHLQVIGITPMSLSFLFSQQRRHDQRILTGMLIMEGFNFRVICRKPCKIHKDPWSCETSLSLTLISLAQWDGQGLSREWDWGIATDLQSS